MVELTILGVGCHRHQALRNNLLDALKAFRFELCLYEESSIEALMQYPISGTPSLLLDGKIVVENRVPSVAELRKLLRRHLKKIHLESLEK